MDYEINYPLQFTGTTEKLTTETKANAEVFNKIYGLLLNNDSFLKAVCDLAAAHMENMGIHVTEKQKEDWDAKATTALATPTTDGLMPAADKGKINSVAAGAEVNQNAYSNVKVGGTTIAANGKTAAIELVPGNNVTLAGDNATKRVTISIPSSLPANGGRSASAAYADTAGNANKLIGRDWNLSGQQGQPAWLWGCTDGAAMYVYNPANFSVASAATLNGQPSAPVAIQATAPATNCLWVW